MAPAAMIRYGLRFMFAYVAIFAIFAAGATILAAKFEFDPPDPSIGAFIGAAVSTFGAFLNDRGRYPSRAEYWSLVLTSTLIVVLVDLALGAAVLHFEYSKDIDTFVAILMIGVSVAKGIVGSSLFYSKRVGSVWLKTLETHGGPIPGLSSRDVVRLGFWYALVYIASLSIAMAVGVAIFYLSGFRFNGLDIAAAVVSTLVTYAIFIRGRRRLPSSREYWGLVVLSASILVVIRFPFDVIAWSLTGRPDLNAVGYASIFGIAVLTGLLVSMVLYSRFVGGWYLMRTQSRRSAGRLA